MATKCMAEHQCIVFLVEQLVLRRALRLTVLAIHH